MAELFELAVPLVAEVREADAAAQELIAERRAVLHALIKRGVSHRRIAEGFKLNPARVNQLARTLPPEAVAFASEPTGLLLSRGAVATAALMALGSRQGDLYDRRAAVVKELVSLGVSASAIGARLDLGRKRVWQISQTPGPAGVS